MSRRKPRRLTGEELQLWQKVRDTTVPLQARRKGPIRKLPPEVAPEAPETPAEAPQPAAPEPIPPFRIGEAAGPGRHAANAPLPDLPARRPINMDARTFDRLRRGRLAPEARLDLHGMTLAEAHPALTGFILSAQTRGLRLVLVITGKGRGGDGGGPIPERRGVLRQQVPQWLSSPPLRLAVVQVTEAHRRHGGGGAFYVYLRRRR